MCCRFGVFFNYRFFSNREMKKQSDQFYATGQSGFTLLELMVTIAIVGLMSGVASYSFLSGMPERRVIKSVRALYNGIQDARSEAVERGQDITITFNSGNYIVTDPNNIEISRHEFLDYIDLYSVTGGGGGDQYTFNGRGMKTGVNGRVRIQYTRSGPLKRGVRVTSVGGVSMIDETDANWL